MKLRALVLYCDDRFRREARLQVGRSESAKILLEVGYSNDLISPEKWEEIVGINPDVVLFELDSRPDISLKILRNLHQNLHHIPIVAVGDGFDSLFLIEALRLGVKEILPKPATIEGVHEAFAKIHEFAGPALKSADPATIFSFFSSKGGSGSTTVATNFSISLAKLSKKKILVLDLDEELGDAAAFFGIKGNKFLVQDGVEDSVLDPVLIARSIVTHDKSGIDLLSFGSGFPRKSKTLGAEVRPLLKMLESEYDYIIIDASSSINDITVSALDLSHLIFLISKCNLPALRNTQRVLHGFERLGYAATRVRLLINRYLKSEHISIKEIERAVNFSVFWTIPNDYKSLIRSAQTGDPLTLQTDSIPVARSFYELSAKVLGIPIQKPAKSGNFVVPTNRNKSLPLTTLGLLKS